MVSRGKEHSAQEIVLSRGITQEEAARRTGVAYHTYCRWWKENGGMKVSQAKRLKELEKDNARLKRLLSNAEPDKAILKEATTGATTSQWTGRPRAARFRC